MQSFENCLKCFIMFFLRYYKDKDAITYVSGIWYVMYYLTYCFLECLRQRISQSSVFCN